MYFTVKPKNRYIEVKAKGNEGIVTFPTFIPGSYVIREMERNIVEINGIRISKNKFYVKDKFSYLIYAASPDQREAISTNDYLFINPPAVFPFQDKSDEYCVELLITWKINTTLKRKGNVFCADNYNEFADSPIEASPNLKLLDVDDNHAVSTLDEINIEKLGKIVNIADSIMGIENKGKRYLFHFRRSDKNYGGIEHLNSSAIVVPWEAKEIERIFAHEYFHRLNVKQLIPADLNIDYETETYSELLWFAEGFTDYMSWQIVSRSNVVEPKDVAKGIANSLQTLTFPGSKRMSLAESSRTTWIKYYKRDANFLNSAISYYDGGLALALYVDMELNGKGERIDTLFKKLERKYTAEQIFSTIRRLGVDIEDLV
ncbi:M61 family metallopeptidase, partial [Acidianus sp. RZ1]|uniref:M61 family metallopeptidase n=1 Tax=Acidianus sp. RZ1 TaxID=1540082 RepID=UPI001492FF9E